MTEPSEENLIEYLDEVDKTMDETGHEPCGCEAIVRNRVKDYSLLARQVTELGKTVAEQATEIERLRNEAAMATEGAPCVVLDGKGGRYECGPKPKEDHGRQP